MKIFKKIALVLFILALPVMLFTTSVSTATNCVWLYKYGFSKYDIPRVTGIEDAELDRVAHGLISYWDNDDETFNIKVIKNGQLFTLFNEREVSHLVDVKALFHFMYQCLLWSFIYAIVYLGLTLFLWKDRKLLAAGLLWGSGLSILLMIILGLLAVTDFQWLFWQFHLLSFTNDLWLLDPRTDYLIMLFPEGFWFDAAIICSAFKVFLALILGFIGWRMLKKNAV
jgi:integral membrane protein (TIGR01906 family)